jgi:hypothetical protein
MGVLSELVAAPKSEARLVAESDSPSRDWQGIVWKGLDQIKLASLWSILEGEQIEVDSVVASSERMELAANVSENGPWVFAIPEELRNLLADLAGKDDDRMRSVARAWASTDELKDWDHSDVTGLLQEVIDLADGARLAGNDLLLWICL